MSALHIVSSQPGGGKTCLAGALAQWLGRQNRSVAYYKPISDGPEADRDVAFMAQLCADRETAAAPQPLDRRLLPQLTEERRQQINDAVAALEAAVDTALVEWALPAAAGADEYPGGGMAALLAGRPILLLYQYVGGRPAEDEARDALAAAQALGPSLSALLVNVVRRHRQLETERELIAVLRAEGLPVAGAIPEDRRLLALTVQQLAEHLGGRWLWEPADPNKLVDRFLIGGNIMDSGPNYFGRYPDQAVITRAARPDIQLASLMCDTRCLVLTGGEEPTEYVRVEAQKRSADLLLVAGNTLDTAEALAGLLNQAHPYSRQKLTRFENLVEQRLDGGLGRLVSGQA